MSLDTATPIERRVVTAEGGVVTTPTLRRLVRRAWFWVALTIAVLVFALVSIAIAGTGAAGPTLSGTSASPAGAKALMQVLRSDGVTVDTPRTLGAAVRASRSGGTVAVYDTHDILTSAQLGRLRDSADRLVLITPSFRMLAALAPDVRLAGVGTSTFPADSCGFGPVDRAGTVGGTSSVYRVSSTATGGYSKCLPDGDGAYSIIASTGGSQQVVVFGLRGALSNEHILDRGNAALALGTFGQDTHLTWYLPSQADVTLSAADRPVPLPGWVLPTELLAVIVVLAAAIWRGRRFGPLVIERLPVVVRASETMEGRARLYQRASSRVHALDAIRIGAIGRLAELCGLPALATVDQVIAAVSVATGTEAGEVRALLVDELPTTDARMLALTARLDDLETAVDRATRPV